MNSTHSLMAGLDMHRVFRVMSDDDVDLISAAFQLSCIFENDNSLIVNAFVASIGFQSSIMMEYLLSPETMTIPKLDGGFLSLLMRWLRQPLNVLCWFAHFSYRHARWIVYRNSREISNKPTRPMHCRIPRNHSFADCAP